MTLAEARKALKHPLKFGDTEQIKAVKFLREAEELADSDIDLNDDWAIEALRNGKGIPDDLLAAAKRRRAYKNRA